MVCTTAHGARLHLFFFALKMFSVDTGNSLKKSTTKDFKSCCLPSTRAVHAGGGGCTSSLLRWMKSPIHRWWEVMKCKYLLTVLRVICTKLQKMYCYNNTKKEFLVSQVHSRNCYFLTFIRVKEFNLKVLSDFNLYLGTECDYF